MLLHHQLLSKPRKPLIVEFAFAALDELPCASIVRTFLDSEVDVADGDVILALVVKDGLERGYDLQIYRSEYVYQVWLADGKYIR